MAEIVIIGCGYVGAVSAACLADLEHRVHCIDIDADRIAQLQAGRSPIYEPGLDTLIERGIASGRLTFSSAYPERISASVVFIAVNTPGSREGAADLRAVRDAVTTVARRMRPGAVIVNKSTVPIGTGDLVKGMAERTGTSGLAVVSNPEFLREGSAIQDFMHPDRIVLGSDESWASDVVASLYERLNAPVLRVDMRTAEMIKYASNAFLATKISFINEMAAICDALGADVQQVANGMGLDSRIGGQFLSAGLGWGGSCFPKDVRALAHMAAVHGAHPQLLRSVIDINSDQRLRVVSKTRSAIGELEGRRVAVLGAAFKADTDDTRNSPALELANLLVLEGASVVVFDPIVPAAVIQTASPGVDVAHSLGEAVADADAVIVATDWAEFKTMDLGAVATGMRGNVVIDTRNCLPSDSVMGAGLSYHGIGRPGIGTQVATSAERETRMRRGNNGVVTGV